MMAETMSAECVESAKAEGGILKIEDLHTYFTTYQGVVQALNGVDLELRPGEILGLVGETGSGKSVTSLSILRLIRPPGKLVKGRILYRGKDLAKLSEEQMRHLRGRDISMIFQSPRRCLNPVFTVGAQMLSILRTHQGLTRERARERAIELLSQVGLHSPPRILKSFAHELSSGMCQRVMIAMALSSQPDILLADEPTTGLDVTLQAQIMKLIREQVDAVHSACIVVTHDLGVVAENTNRTAVMYGGRVMEMAGTEELFEGPRHPYTRGLMRATLRVDVHKEIHVIPGVVPNLIDMPRLCAFRDRCDERMEICDREDPPVVYLHPGHYARCHLLA